jgi:hypothetical protein
MRYLAADKHPDHDTLCAFRRNNAPLVREIFTAVLLTAQELKLLKVGNISIDGTKIQANASKHKAISHKRACEQIELLESEVSQLMLKAEAADNKDLADGFTLPGEIALRQHRLKKLQQARKNIEERLEPKTCIRSGRSGAIFWPRVTYERFHRIHADTPQSFESHFGSESFTISSPS